MFSRFPSPDQVRGRAFPYHALSSSVLAEHDPNQIGRAPGAELFHDPGPVNFNGAITDAELLAGFLIGGALDKLPQHILLARRERLATGKIELRLVGDAAVGLAPEISGNGFPHPRDNVRAAE